MAYIGKLGKMERKYAETRNGGPETLHGYIQQIRKNHDWQETALVLSSEFKIKVAMSTVKKWDRDYRDQAKETTV